MSIKSQENSKNNQTEQVTKPYKTGGNQAPQEPKPQIEARPQPAPPVSSGQGNSQTQGQSDK